MNRRLDMIFPITLFCLILLTGCSSAPADIEGPSTPEISSTPRMAVLYCDEGMDPEITNLTMRGVSRLA